MNLKKINTKNVVCLHKFLDDPSENKDKHYKTISKISEKGTTLWNPSYGWYKNTLLSSKRHCLPKGQRKTPWLTIKGLPACSQAEYTGSYLQEYKYMPFPCAHWRSWSLARAGGPECNANRFQKVCDIFPTSNVLYFSSLSSLLRKISTKHKITII